MLRVQRALGDPLRQQLLLPRREILVRIRRRHLLIRIVGGNPVDQFAVVGIARREGVPGQRDLAHIEPELGLTMLFVRPVAVVALVRKDGTDVAIEIGLGWAGHRWRGTQQ